MNDIEKLLLELVNLGFLDNTPGINRPYKEVDGIYGPKTAKAHKEYLASLNNKKLPERTPTLMSFQEIKDYENLINLKSNEEIINHYHTSINSGQPYIIDDKLNNKLRVYINGKLIREYDAIHGKYSTTFGNYYNKKIEINNDSYTVKPGDNLSLLAKNAGTTVDVLLKLNNISDPNLIHVGDVIKFPGVSYLRTEVNPDEMTVTYVDDKGHIKNLAGNLTTPAGIYYSTKSARNYNGAPSFYRRTKELVDKNLLAGIPSSIHARNIVEGANTNGCTGLCKKDLYDLSNLLNGYDTIPTYILPADKRNKFKIRNGLLSFSSHDLSKTPSQHTIDYSPINKITFSNKDLDENKKKTIRNFSLGLIRNKEVLLKDLKINNDTYNLLALYALGILGAETNYGDKHSGISNLLHAVGKYISKSNSSPDYESKYFTYGAKENYRSIGLTLIRPMYLSYDELKLMTKYKINKKDLVTDPQKAAIATMIKLASEYKKLGMDFDKAIASWNTRSNYVDRVKNNSKRFNIYLKYMKAKTGGILKYLTGNSIVYEYLKAIENPDSVGWDGKVWRAPTIKGFDKNQRAFGLDVVKNEAVRKLTEGRPGRWLTDSEAAKLMNDHIDYVNGAATRHIKGFTTFSPKRLAALLGMLYRGDSVNKSGINLLEPNDNKFFKSISDYYRKIGFPERANNSDKFFNVYKKGGKMKRAFVPEVNVLDSNPDIKKKKKKLKKAAEGTKMSVGLWLNGDTGLVFTNLGMLLWSGIQNNYFLNKVKKDLEQWKSSYLKSFDDNLPDFTLLATQMEKEGLQDGQNASPISIAKKNWDLLQQYRLKMLALASIAADLLILNLLSNLLKLTNSGWGDILSAGLGIAGSFLSKKNDNNLKQTTTV